MNLLETFFYSTITSGRYQGPMTPKVMQFMQQYQSVQQQKAIKGGFGQVLMNMSSANSMVMPMAPAPPTNPADPAEQQKYNQAVTIYNQQYQRYNTSITNMMFQRFAQMQQTMQQGLFQIQRAQSTSNNNNSSSSSSAGTGGILSTDSIDV